MSIFSKTSDSTIIVFAESCHNLAERFSPLVEEILLASTPTRLVGIFVGFELGSQRIDDGGLFTETHFFAEPVSAATFIRTIPQCTVISFINHNATVRDSRLYTAVRNLIQNKAYVLRNRINLKRYLITGIDDDDVIRPKITLGRKVYAAIQIKALLLSCLAAVIICLGKVFKRVCRVTPDRKKKILFIKLDVLGDMIVTLPYISALRDKFSDADLTVLCSNKGAAILREQSALYERGLCDNILTWDAPWHIKFPKVLGLDDLLELFRRLPSFWMQRYDIIIQPVNFGTGIAFAVLALGRRVLAVIDSRLPLAMRMRRFVSDPVDIGQERIFHLKDFSELVLSRLGVKAALDVPGLVVGIQARESVELFLRERGYRKSDKLFLFNVGAGHPLRMWGAEKFAELAVEVSARHDATLVLTGSQDERVIASEIERLSSVSLINSAGLISFNELIALTSMADLMITVDTGIMHLAAALNTPLVAIFGAGLVDYCKPLSRNHVIVKHELGCSGCADRCFAPLNPPCLERVTVSEVYEALENLLLQK